jgi:predicted peptidase
MQVQNLALYLNTRSSLYSMPHMFKQLGLACAIVAYLSLAHPAPGAVAEPGRQVECEFKGADGKTMPYLLYLPEDYNTQEKWPLVLFLHGRGESDGPLSVVKKWGPPRLVERGEKLKFILASPQCPRQDSWPQPSQQQLLVGLLAELRKELKVDGSRVYLTGLSMGGYGSWRLAADHPEMFAAVVPVCGAGKTGDAPKLKSLPIWVFHGTEDSAVPFARSKEMVDAIKQAGGTNIRFTTLEYIGHNSWESAYASPELWSWMLSQRQK